MLILGNYVIHFFRGGVDRRFFFSDDFVKHGILFDSYACHSTRWIREKRLSCDNITTTQEEFGKYYYNETSIPYNSRLIHLSKNKHIVQLICFFLNFRFHVWMYDFKLASISDTKWQHYMTEKMIYRFVKKDECIKKKEFWIFRYLRRQAFVLKKC